VVAIEYRTLAPLADFGGFVDKRKGMKFQNFVGMIERTFGGQEGVTVEVGKGIPDKTTGRARDFDILITARVGHHVMKTGIECRDKGRNIDVPAIEGFAKKCQRQGVGTMVMVASGAFAKEAIEVAKDEGVKLMTLKQATSFDWVGTTVFVKRQRKFAPWHVGFGIVGEKLPVEPFTAFNMAGVEITGQILMINAEQALPNPAELPKGVQKAEFRFTEEFKIVDANGEEFRSDGAVLRVEYEWEETSEPFELHEYKGEGIKYEVATSKLNLPGISANLVFRKQGNGEIAVMIMPDEAPAAEKPKRVRKSRAKPKA
jgi:hypothetical protein